jgi:hypothetical protein
MDTCNIVKYNTALAVFFHLLANISYRREEIIDFLEDIGYIASKLQHVSKDMRNVFKDLTLVDESGAAYAIANRTKRKLETY